MEKRKMSIWKIAVAAVVVVILVILAVNWRTVERAAKDAWNLEYSPADEDSK